MECRIRIQSTRTHLASDPSSLRNTSLHVYVSEYAQEIAAVLPRSIQLNHLNGFSEVLPDILEAFAVHIGHEGTTVLHMDLMYLVHKTRALLSKAVIEPFSFEEENSVGNEGITPTGDNFTMLIEEKISLWQSQDHVSRSEMEDQTPWHAGVEEHDEFDDYPKLQEYPTLLVSSSAFSWLASSVLKQVNMVTPEDRDSQVEIRQPILATLPDSSRISRRRAPPQHTVVFESV